MPGHSRGLLRLLYVQVLIAVVIGGTVGVLWPEFAATLQPIADAFIKLIKMLLAPIIFGTMVVGIARMGSIREVGRIGVKALIYFEVVSTLALGIGLVVVNLVRPGEGMNIDANGLDGSAVAGYARSASESGGLVGFLLGIIPTTVVDAFARGAMLQVILLGVLFGVAMVQMGERAKPPDHAL